MDALASRLGFQRLNRRPVLYLGDHDGYMATISRRHSLSASYVDVLVRFPQKHTVRAMREDLLTNESLLKAFGRRKRLPRVRRRNLYVGDGSVLLRLPYSIFPPRGKTIERALDGIVGAMKDHVKTLDRLCEGCSQPADVSIYLGDGIPGIYCPSCVTSVVSGEKELAEQLRRADPDVARGTGIGFGAAFAFGVSLGAVASIAISKAGPFWIYLAAPIYLALGVLVSAFAGRGFGVSNRSLPILLKLAQTMFGAAIAFTFMNAVATMTLKPAEWNLVLFLSSLRGGAIGGLRGPAQVLLASALAGWALETAWELLRSIGKGTRTRIERVLADGVCEEMN